MQYLDFIQEPAHSNKLLIRANQPYNAEPPLSSLAEFPYTPQDLLYWYVKMSDGNLIDN